MAAARALNLTLASWRARLGCALLLLLSVSLGCVNLNAPSAGSRPGGSSSSLAGARDAGTVSGGGSVGGAGGSSSEAGLGGSTSFSSSTGAGGSPGVDAPADLPPATGGIDAASVGGGVTGGSKTGPDAGPVGGSAGHTGATALDAGGGSGGTSQGTGSTGAAGQDGGVARDLAPARDTPLPDGPCPLCGLGTSLVHRYNFSGTGTTVTDSVGTANGTVTGAQLSGTGTLVLEGGTSNPPYAELPKGILSALTSATLEIWVTWTGGSSNQRILDFGNNELVNGRTSALTTVIISPNSGPTATAKLRASYSSAVATGSTFVEGTAALPTGSMQQIVAVFDGVNHTLSMYLNGVSQGQIAWPESLSLIKDDNNWLGKSQYTGDPGFAGTYHEFRIFNAPLTAAQVQAVYAAGTGASFPP